jgi:calcineurin-like phosphoesterase family protein
MGTYVLSDLHLYHDNIIGYCSRPFEDVDAMNRHFVVEWNARVAPDDIVVVVGDMSAGLRERRSEFAELLRTLEGKKVLIRGNHDHEPDDFYLENGFQCVKEHLHLAGVVFHHFPPSDDRKDNNSIPWGTRCALRYLERYKPWAFLHGHDHRVDVPERPGCFNCASDRLGHTPLPLIDALQKVDQQLALQRIRHVEAGLTSLVQGL